jgi:hypothetical protein
MSISIHPRFAQVNIVDQFVFIWGCEQCTKTLGQLIVRTYYYIKDLNHVYFACRRLHYGIEDETLFFDNEPSKAFWNSKYNGILLNLLEDINCQRIRSNGWTSSCLWPSLVRLPIVRIIDVHYEIIVKYSKPQLTFLLNYF